MVKWIRPQGTVTDLMSHSRFHLYWKYVLRRAWLSLWNKHMLPTGSIGYHKLCLDVSGGIFFTNIYTPCIGYCFVRLRLGFVFIHMYTLTYVIWWCTLLVLWCDVPLFYVFHMMKEQTLFTWYSFRVLYDCCSYCYRVYQYSTSESLIFSFHFLYMYLLSMDQRPETRTFGRLLHQPYFTAAFLYYCKLQCNRH